MSRESIYIIGGGASGISCATRLRRLQENCDITIVEQSEYIGYSTAALPLFISGKIEKKEILLSDYEEKLTAVYNINVLKKSEVTKIDRTKKNIYIKSRDSENSIEKSYDKIVFSTGCRFNIPNLFGANSDNFFKFSGLNDAIAIKNYIDKYSPLSISVIGLNRVSLPLVNELANCGFVVNAIDSSNKILPDFNDEFDYILKEEISKAGVKIFMNNDSLKFSKNEANSISKIEVSKQTIDTQMVIYCDRIIPNSVLAKNSGLEIGCDDGILVDDKMATSDKNIYACGSVTESINMVSKQKDLSHTVNLSEIQGRIAASNLAGLNVSYKGILKTTFVSFNKLKMGSTGLNLSQGKEAGFDADSITIYNGNRERFMPASTQLHIKVIFDRESKKILGAQVCGKGDGVDKRIDVFATAIYAGLTVSNLTEIDFAYHPEISIYKEAINVAGMVSENKGLNFTASVSLKDIKADEDFIILDVRTKNEFNKEHLLNTLWIPLDELRKRISEIPNDKKIYVYGHVGLRGYIAERILKGNGFKNVYNIDGGITSIKILENIN